MYEPITLEELAALLDEGVGVRLIDVLKPDHYEAVHLPGAINVPAAELAERAPDLFDPDDLIVVYCSSFDCEQSTSAARILDDLGFTNVYDFEGGIAEWRRRGLPVVRRREPAGEPPRPRYDTAPALK